jgi:CheY-like chemotaxis protein
VLVARNGSAAIFRVKDSGIGISPSLLPRIFDLFMQADRSLDRSQGGLGIGLTLVRMLVEMHGGTVAVESPGEGHGSEFTVRLPLADGPAEGESAAASLATPTSRRDGLARRRVLVVDDNVDAADMLAEAIRALGHDVRLAHDGPAAIHVAQAFAPEVVFLDIGLPGMDGYEVAVRLRRPPLAPMTLVALTGYGRDADKLRARDAGFDQHLVKPVDIDVVERIVAGEDAAKAHYGLVSPEEL